MMLTSWLITWAEIGSRTSEPALEVIAIRREDEFV